MTDNATPKKRATYSRPTKFPAALPRTMTTVEQRRRLDDIREATEQTLGEIIRELLNDGLDMRAVRRETHLAVERLAAESGVTKGEAIETMLAFAAREATRRTARNIELAAGVADTFAEGGIVLDMVEAGNVAISAEH